MTDANRLLGSRSTPRLDCPNLDLQTEVEQLRLNEQHFKQRHLVLLRLALSQQHPEHSFEQKLRDFTEGVAEYFQVERAGVWLLNRDATLLKCVDHFVRGERTHSTGFEIATKNYPVYFTSLSQQRVIAAPIADADPRTRELAEDYLAKHGITSLLETPLKVCGESRGVLCCEHIGSPRHWSAEDQQFIVALADLIAMTVTAHDVQCAEEELRKSEQLYRTVVEDQTDLIIRYLPDGTRTFVNEAYCRYHGKSREELLGGQLWHCLSPQETEIVRRSFSALTVLNPVDVYVYPFKQPNGDFATIQWLNRGIFDKSGQLREIQAIGRDVTEQQQTEERLRVAKQLESTAMLASGIAHDFNNLLTPILLTAEKLRSTHLAERECRGHADEILAAAQQAKDLVSQLLSLSTNSSEKRHVGVAAEESIRASLRIIGNSLPVGIKFRTRIALSGHTVRAGATDIYQILSNLCSNAAQAMDGEGQIDVSVEAKTEDPQYLQLLVTDTGKGIPSENLGQVFDPYFSTKGPGDGTGLGLSIVRSIVSRLGGTISVTSEVGQGATFSVLIPCHTPDDVSAAPTSAKLDSNPPQHLDQVTNSAAPMPEEIRRRVLIVDDEELVRNSIAKLLTAFGYDTHAVSSLAESLSVLKSNPVDTILVDMNLNEGNSLQAASQLREAAKSTQAESMPRLIAMSGGDVAQLLDSKDHFDGFLSKPFSGEELCAVLTCRIAD